MERWCVEVENVECVCLECEEFVCECELEVEKK